MIPLINASSQFPSPQHTWPFDCYHSHTISSQGSWWQMNRTIPHLSFEWVADEVSLEQEALFSISNLLRLLKNCNSDYSFSQVCLPRMVRHSDWTFFFTVGKRLYLLQRRFILHFKLTRWETEVTNNAMGGFRNSTLLLCSSQKTGGSS